jgi:superfamily II DNA/RNA helicase
MSVMNQHTHIKKSMRAVKSFTDEKGYWEAPMSAQRGKNIINEQEVKRDCPTGSFDPYKIPDLMNPRLSREELLVERQNKGDKLTKTENMILTHYIKKQQDKIDIDKKNIEKLGLNAKPETIEGKMRFLFLICKYYLDKKMYDMIYYTMNKIKEYTIPSHISDEYSKQIEEMEELTEDLNKVELQFTKFHSSMPPLNENGFMRLDPFQKEVITNIDNNKSMIVQAPTSAGKSILTSYLYTKENIKTIVIVPTDPLAWQMASMISKITKKDPPIITRTFQSETSREELIKKIKSVGIVVGTPTYLVDFLPLISSDFKFDWIVFDEIHMIGSTEMETIAKVYNDIPTMALSATIGNVEMLRDWFLKIGHKNMDIVICDKRFFNLQKFYYDTKDNKLVRIHPFSTVSIEDFITGDIIKKSLNPTPPDIWDLANEIEDILPESLQIENYFDNEQRITLDQSNEYFIKILEYIVSNISKKQKFIANIIKKYNHNVDKSDYDLYTIAMTLKKENKTPALVFQTNSHECLELVRQFSKRIRSEEEIAHPHLLKERLKLQSFVKAEQKKLGKDIIIKDKRGNNKKVSINMNSIGDKKKNKLMMSGELEKMEMSIPDVAIFEPHPDFIMNKDQIFTHAKMEEWNKQLKVFFPQNGSEYHYLLYLLWRGVGVYCKGLPDQYLHIIQNLACSGKLGLVFSDDSLVYGVSMPFRTTIITPDNNMNSMIYHQMAGRAGRRGLDKEGNVIMVGYSWNQIKDITTSIIPKVSGCDTMYYGASFASRMPGGEHWNNIKKNFLLESLTKEDAHEFYTSVESTLVDGWEFATSDNVSFNHMLWRFRHSEDCIRVAFLITFIRKIFKNCNPTNENTQIEFSKFMANFIEIIETDDNNALLTMPEIASKYPIKQHMLTLGLEIPDKIDNQIYKSIQMNKLVDTNNKSSLRERLFNFGEKIRNIQHYFFHCGERDITRLLGKLITRIWWIYHSSSPVMDNIDRYEEISHKSLEDNTDEDDEESSGNEEESSEDD